nr:hypothetical protein [Tanacetum cinerariifolium]
MMSVGQECQDKRSNPLEDRDLDIEGDCSSQKETKPNQTKKETKPILTKRPINTPSPHLEKGVGKVLGWKGVGILEGLEYWSFIIIILMDIICVCVFGSCGIRGVWILDIRVWSLVNCLKGVRPIGTKWVLKNKKDERGIVIRNKAMLVAQGHTQEEGIDYEEVFAPVARIKAIRLFLAYASFMGFTVYQMDVKSAFLYGTIDEEVYVMQPHGFQDLEYPSRVYKVEKAIYGLHQAPRAWYGTLSKYLLSNGFQRALMHEKFQMSAMGELNFFPGLQVLQKEDGIFLSQDKYVGDFVKKFGYSDVRSSNTPMQKENPWGKDGTGKDVDHLYRSMIGSLMYLTASRPDIMFVVCACARNQVTPKECHLHAVKRIFKYLKGHPKLGLWYPKDSPFDLVAYSDSDYGGASQDRKSTSEGRLISWQCKKQTIIATLITKAEYVAAASCCGQVLWIQNQLLDYGHHFIRDCFEKKLINVDHIHTDENVSDLLTKPFNAGRFQLSMSCETLSKEISTSILRLLYTAKTLDLVWIWLGGDYGNVFFMGFNGIQWYALTFKPTIYVSHIRQFWSTARIETTEEGTQILAIVDEVLRTITESSLRSNLKLQDEEGISSLPDMELFENLTLMGYNISPNQKFTFQKGFVPLFDSMLIQQGEGSGTPTEPHHTPSQEAQPSSPTHISTSSIPIVIPIPTVTQFEPTPLRKYTRRARIAQSFALPPVANEPASPMRYVSEREACPTNSGFIADQDRATIAKSSTLPYDTAPRVTSSAAIEGMEINKLNARVKILEDNQGVIGVRSADDAPIKGRRIDEEEGITRRVSTDTEEIRMDEREVAIERTSRDTEEMANVLTSMDAATVLAGGIDVPTGSYSIPTAGPPAIDIHTGSDAVPTASSIVATATVVTSYSRRKGKEVMVESDTLKKQRDARVERIHAEEELQGMIDSLDRTNETIAKYLQEYQDFALELPLERRIELISDLVKYQDNYSKIYKFQSQQRIPWTKKQKRDYYMTVIGNNLGWKVKDFKGMTFEEIKAKFATVWKSVEDFIPMGSKEEVERLKRKGFNLEQEKAKKQKTSEEVPDKEKSPKEIPEEKVKEMMQLVPIEEVYVEALQVKHHIIDWKHLDREDLNQLWVLVKEYLSIRPASSKKEMELLVELKRLGVHYVTAKDKEIFMLVEQDYPLRKGLALVMICYKLQVENYSQMAEDLIRKIYNIANSLRQQGIKCTRHSHCWLESSHYQKELSTTRRKVLPLPEEIRDQLNAEAEAVQIILTGIENDIYSTVDACPNACELWKAIEQLKQGESINVQDLETNLFWEFGKFTSLHGETLESYYSRFYKMMNELTRNQCKVTNHQANVQFLLQLQPEWQWFVTLVKQSQELKHVSYHKL